jgi:hypothetical protein
MRNGVAKWFTPRFNKPHQRRGVTTTTDTDGTEVVTPIFGTQPNAGAHIGIKPMKYPGSALILAFRPTQPLLGKNHRRLAANTIRTSHLQLTD